MSRRFRQRGQIMLIILGTLFVGAGAATGVFTSGKSIDAIRKDVKSLRLSESRQAQVLALLDRWEALADPALSGFEAYGQELLALIRTQATSQSDFERVLEQQRSELRETESRLLPLRDELRAALSENEWNRLFD